MKHVKILNAATLAAVFAVLSCCASGCASSMLSNLIRHESLPTTSGKKSTRLTQDQKVNIQFHLGKTLERHGDLDRAEELYREMLAKDADNAAVIHRLAIVCDQQGRFDESQPLFHRAMKLTPEDTVLMGDYAYSLYRQQEWDEAESVLRDVLAIDPRDKRARNHLGLVLAQLNRADEAMHEFRLAGCSPDQAQSNLLTVMRLSSGEDTLSKQFQLSDNIERSDAAIASPVGHAMVGGSVSH